MRDEVPIISTFFGICIRMYHNDHAPPHFHAEYQGHEALIDIAHGRVIEGRLPRAAERLIHEWCANHQSELLANWEKARNLLPLERIQGADYD